MHGELTRQLAKFGAMNMEGEIGPKRVESFLQRKANCQEEIEHLQKELETLKAARKETARHIAIDELPEEEKFQKLSTPSKYLIDTIKMIAYRAETAMANLLRETMTHPDESRSLLRALYRSDADLLPDKNAGTLTVRLHHMANPCSDAVIEKLCAELNATKMQFPGTDLRLVLKLGLK